MQKSVAFSYNKGESAEKEFKKSILFSIVTKQRNEILI